VPNYANNSRKPFVNRSVGVSPVFAQAHKTIEKALRPLAAFYMVRGFPDEERKAIIKAELETERRLGIAGDKIVHKAIPYNEAGDEEWYEAKALAALRALGEIQRETNQAIREAVELIYQKHGTSAIRLAEASGLSNGTTAKWTRPFREEAARSDN